MHGTFTCIYHKNQPNVGKYTSPMDPIGNCFLTRNPLQALSDQDKVKSLEHDPELQEMFEAGNRDEILTNAAISSLDFLF